MKYVTVYTGIPSRNRQFCVRTMKEALRIASGVFRYVKVNIADCECDRSSRSGIIYFQHTDVPTYGYVEVCIRNG
jgi:hypothetical protein